MGQTIIQRIKPKGRNGKEKVITVRDVFNLLAKGMNTRAICKQRPDIKPETVLMARAFLIANHPELYNERISPAPDNNYRLLVDENISARIIPHIREGFNYATHTNFVGLNGKKDPEVWQWAVNNRIDAILTGDKRMVDKDRDLTLIAIENAKDIMRKMGETGLDVNLSELPLVIHVDPLRNDVTNTVAALFRKHQAKIHEYLETRSRPYIKVTAGGVIEGPRYVTLLQQEKPEIKAHANQWVEQWTTKIIKDKPDGDKMSLEQIEEVRQRVKDTMLPEILKSIIPTMAASTQTRSGLLLPPKGTLLP